jgi:hypothetical protein
MQVLQQAPDLDFIEGSIAMSSRAISCCPLNHGLSYSDATRYRRATAVKNINVPAEQGRVVRGGSLHEDQLDL